MQGLICGGLCVLLGACASRARPTTAAPITSNLTPPSERMTMDYEFQITHAPQRTLMVVHAEVHCGRELVTAIKGGLDQVWAYLKANGAKAGHNVVVYRTFEPGPMMVDSGVQVDAPLPGNGTVVPVTTPGGTVVTTVHIGPYNKIGDASSALANSAWCTTTRSAARPGKSTAIGRTIRASSARTCSCS